MCRIVLNSHTNPCEQLLCMYLLVNQVIISLEQIRLVLTDIMAAYINTTRHSVDYCSELLLTEAQC